MMNRTHARADRSAEGCVYVLGDGRVGRHVAARPAGDRAVHLLGRSLPEDLPDGRGGVLARRGNARRGRRGRGGRRRRGGAERREEPLTQLSRSRFDVDRIVVLVNDTRRTPAFDALDVEVVDAATVLGRAVAERCPVTRD